jgi:hypothetical protein
MSPKHGMSSCCGLIRRPSHMEGARQSTDRKSVADSREGMVFLLGNWADCQEPLSLMKRHTGSRNLTDSVEMPKQRIRDMRFRNRILEKYMGVWAEFLWLSVGTTVVCHRVPWKARNFLTSLAMVNLKKTPVLHEISYYIMISLPPNIFTFYPNSLFCEKQNYFHMLKERK